MTTYYHYTDISALFNIFKHKTIWFSCLNYMNDQMEGLELHRVLTDILKETHSAKNCNQVIMTVKAMSDVFISNKYLFCATELNDHISQWRAYTSIGTGICIGFEDGFITDSTILKRKCLYDLLEKKDFLIKSTELLKYDDNKFSKINNIPNGTNNFIYSVLHGMEHFKHESFSSEKEVRWIDDLNEQNNKPINFRPHRLGLMPYREISADLIKISEIILGPQVPKQNIGTISKLFINQNLNPKIHQSTVTLR